MKHLKKYNSNNICIDVFSGFTYEKLLPMAKEIGFDGFFSDEQSALLTDELKKLRAEADGLGLEYETSHSTIPGCTSIWSEGRAGDDYVDVLKNNIDNCSKLSIPILVVHVQVDSENEPSFEIGINRLENVVRYAKEKKVKIAFENINSPEYLFRVLNNFNTPDVGFCYDCGHEACHTPGVRYLPIIGNRLMCTHIHDNDNKSDLHLIPFDGEIDFKQICKELKAINYKGNITLELCYSDKYKAELSDYDFLKKCYESAEKIRSMIWD